MDETNRSQGLAQLAMARLLANRDLCSAAADLAMQVIAMSPEMADAWALFGAVNMKPTPLRRAVIINPDHCDALTDLAQMTGGEPAAIFFEAALKSDPGYLPALTNYGLWLQNRGQSAAALPYLADCVAIDPGHDVFWSNLSTTAIGAGFPDSGIRTANRALTIRPEAAAAQYNLGMSHLMRGELEKGFIGHESRFAAGAVPDPHIPGNRWHGEIAPEDILLVYAEQGLGDSLLFVRFVPEASRRVRRLILLVQPELVGLFQPIAGAFLVLPFGTSLPEYDLICPLMSLGLVLGARIDQIPPPPALLVDPIAKAEFQRRLSKLPGLKVGLVWQGNPAFPGDRTRSIPLASLRPLASVPFVTLISLQKESTPTPHTDVPELVNWMDEISNLTQTAALIESLDLIIAVDTMLGHLSGNLGKPVWIMNRFNTCWRWFLDRSDSPWYPTLTLFRQSTPGDWDDVIGHVAEELAKYVSHRLGK